MTTDAFLTRQTLSHFQQMQDAQNQCVPCKLCGGSAIISDAGPGAGYYIRCKNSGAFRANDGCMVDDLRLSGWAYNVMEWWNRLHAHPPIQAAEIKDDEHTPVIGSNKIRRTFKKPNNQSSQAAESGLLDEALEVLKPFAKAAEAYESHDGQQDFPDEHVLDVGAFNRPTVGDLRSARTLVAKAGKPGEAANG